MHVAVIIINVMKFIFLIMYRNRYNWTTVVNMPSGLVVDFCSIN